MKKNLQIVLVILTLGVSFFPRISEAAVSTVPPTPTLFWPQVLNGQTYLSKPTIRGWTRNETKVEVWIDGQFNGRATVKNGLKKTASFSYVPFLPLRAGSHGVVVRAEDPKSRKKSMVSPSISLIVEPPYPAPTLFESTSRNSTNLLITGVAFNDSKISVFVDGKLDGQFKIKNHDSGVAHFAYKPVRIPDTRTEHRIHAIAIDPRGKESRFSNVIRLTPGYRPAPKKSQLIAKEDTSQGIVAAESVTEESKETAEETENNEEPETAGTTEEKTETPPSSSKQNSSAWWLTLLVLMTLIYLWRRPRKFSSTQGTTISKFPTMHNGSSTSSKISGTNLEQQQSLFHTEKDPPPRKMPSPPPSK